MASYVVLKTFADGDTRKQSGIDRAEAECLLEVLSATVPPTTKTRMFTDQMKVVGGDKSDIIYLAVQLGFADEIGGDIRVALDTLAYSFNGRQGLVQVEREPGVQKRHSIFGRTRAFLQHAVESMDTEHLTSFKFECTWQPDFVILATELDGFADNEAAE
eukprot:5659208-Pyramimonas_sp.AAC.1